jgi:hypothetical protein
VGTKEQVKREEDRFKEYYVNAMRSTYNLFSELKTKYINASARFRKRFWKLDKNNKPIRDPKNQKTWIVDENKFRKYLRENPNEFYNRTGKFNVNKWRQWLDAEWRPEMLKLGEAHKRMKGNYAAIPWPRQYDQLSTVLKMILRRSAEKSFKLYDWNNLPQDEKDKKVAKGDNPGGPGGSHVIQTDERVIDNLIMDIKNRLKLVQFIEQKKAEKEKDKKKKK